MNVGRTDLLREQTLARRPAGHTEAVDALSLATGARPPSEPDRANEGGLVLAATPQLFGMFFLYPGSGFNLTRQTPQSTSLRSSGATACSCHHGR